MSEHNHQVTVVQFFHLQYPAYKAMLMAYPSGAIIGGKNKFGLINKMKREGWKKGVPDLFIAVPNEEYHGLFIEMKDDKKSCKPSLEQVQYINELNSNGYCAQVCWGADDAIELIRQYMAGL